MTRPLSWVRIALIDMRGGLGRFVILLACLALGVATIAVVGSVGASRQAALARDARAVLGGDLEAILSYREANDAELQLFDSLGQRATVIEVLGRGVGGNGSAFLAVRGVDAGYPLIGQLSVAGSSEPLPDLLAERDGTYGVVVDPLLLDRLGLAVGDPLQIGEGMFQIRGTIAKVPDQVTMGVQFGIPALLSIEGLRATNVLAPGVLARFRYKVLLDAGTDFETARDRIEASFPGQGWDVRSPENATEDFARFFDIFTRFLTIVGLSALLVGGVGVSNAVSAYITDRQRSIATLRSLGATNARILVHLLTQVKVLVLAGIVLGLLLGIGITFVALPIIGRLLAIDLPAVVDPVSMLTAAGFGLLVGLAFAWLPLRRAQTLKPALLFRTAGSATGGGLARRDLLDWRLWLPLLAAGGLTYALAIWTTGRPQLVFWYALGAFIGFVVLLLAARLMQRALKLLPPARNAVLRNAVKRIIRPGALAPTVFLSLGLGLSLLLLIALVDSSLRKQLDGEVLTDAPSFVFMDLFDDEAQSLADFTAATPGAETFEAIPMLRGSIAAINGTPLSADRGGDREVAEVLSGEVPLTWAATLPPQSTITEGEWWAADYSGEPLLSVFSELKEPLGLEIGDEVTISIFGDTLTARIANFRNFVWRGGAINFSFVLSPGAIQDFPFTSLGLLKVEPGRERDIQPLLVQQYPNLLFLPVGEALETLNGILTSLINAVAVVGGLALVSGLLVLAGAIAAGRRQREADSVVMKVLGATRRDVVLGYLAEYGLLGLLSAIFALGLGLVGGWAFLDLVLEINFYVDPLLVVGVLGGAVALAITIGLVTTWAALSTRPAGYLRSAG